MKMEKDMMCAHTFLRKMKNGTANCRLLISELDVHWLLDFNFFLWLRKNYLYLELNFKY